MQIDLKKFLKEVSVNEKLYLYPNPGNAGDALIALGTKHLFEALKLNYTQVKDKDNFDPENKIIIYSGGGNLVNYYTNSREFLLENHEKMKRLIILPHTINSNEDLLSAFGNNIDIITRERISYEYVKNRCKKANVYLAEDMAFYMDINRVLSYRPISFADILIRKIIYKSTRNPKIKTIPSPRIFLQAKRNEIITNFLTRGQKPRVLNCFRVDTEKTDFHVPRDNIDLSEVYKFGTDYQELVDYQAKKFLGYLQKFDEIRTNRLHVAIGGALLGKKVYLQANSYFKNRAIYEFSLKDKFPNVTWQES
ncbi:MAG: polysaccharide pyruvyl transferase family protein [Cyclobacteriaceae bacterium]